MPPTQLHFETPGRLSFRQVYFNPEHRTDAAADAKVALAGLSAQGEAEPTAGDRLLFGDSFDDTDELALSRMFGADFAHEVFALEPGAWRGPIKSGYGFHLVFVTHRTPTAPKPFETVRDAVLAEWRSRKQTELSRDYLAELRKKYGVELDDGAKAALAAEPAPTWPQNEPVGSSDPSSCAPPSAGFGWSCWWQPSRCSPRKALAPTRFAPPISASRKRRRTNSACCSRRQCRAMRGLP